MDPVVIGFASLGAETQDYGIGVTKWQEAVTERTGGKVTFENYWSGSLLTADDMLDGLRSGIADMGVFQPSYYPQELPINVWVEGFGREISNSAIHDVAAGSATIQEFALSNEAAMNEYAEQGVKVINVRATSAYNVLCSDSVDSASELSGARARSIGEVFTATLETLGAVPATMSVSEVYEALQRGVLDCVVFPAEPMATVGLTEVAGEYFPLPFAQSFTTIAMNLDTWDGLPSDVQKIMHEEAGAAGRAMWDALFAERSNFGDQIESGSVRVQDVSSLVGTVDAQREQWLADLVNTAPEGVDDPQAVIDDFRERREYWTQVLVEAGYEVEDASDPDALRKSLAGLSDVDLSAFYERYKTEVVEATVPK